MKRVAFTFAFLIAGALTADVHADEHDTEEVGLIVSMIQTRNLIEVEALTSLLRAASECKDPSVKITRSERARSTRLKFEVTANEGDPETLRGLKEFEITCDRIDDDPVNVNRNYCTVRRVSE